MRSTTRRDFLAVLALAGCQARPERPSEPPQEPTTDDDRSPAEWVMGAQSYCFRQFDLDGALDRLGELGFGAIEIYPGHLPVDTAPTDLQAWRRTLSERQVNVCGYGVVGFSGPSETNRRPFELARALDVPIISADPAPEAFDQLEELTDEFAVSIAIHNHGPGSRYQTIEHVAEAVDGRSPRIGACVDTGHAIRSGVNPQEMLRALADRVLAVHLKDWILGGEEQILGEGELDLEDVARALRDIDFDGVISLEYELSPEDPVPDMRSGLTNWRAAL